MTSELLPFWGNLSPELRRQLLMNPHGALPAHFISELSLNGQFVAGSHWVASQDGPNGFRLRTQTAESIDFFRIKLEKWWSGLSEEMKTEFQDNPRAQYPDEYADVIRGALAVDTSSRSDEDGKIVGEGPRFVPMAVDFLEAKASR